MRGFFIALTVPQSVNSFRIKDQYKKEEVASPEGFEKNPQLVLDFYNARRKQLDEVKPNEAHHLIAHLENKYKVTVITQNIDHLHERAGSTNVLHLQVN